MMKNKNADLSSLKIERNSEKTGTGGNRIKKILIPVVIIMFLLLAIYYGWNSLISTGIEVNLVTASKVSPAESNAVLTASGYVVAQRKASVASKATGRLVYLGVVEGDVVKKNQVIARLDDSDLQAELAQAKANLKLAEADFNDSKNNYERQKKLYETGATTQVTLEAAESNYKRVLASIDVAKARVLGAEVGIENTLIRAPFDGTVLTKNADVGEIVSPLGASSTSRAAVVTIADMSSLQVEVDVSESNIQRIESEQECEISLDAYPDLRYPGYIIKIVPTADRAKATVLVKVAFKKYDNKVLPEMSAKVLFLGQTSNNTDVSEKPFLVVPYTAIKNIDGKKCVYLVIDNIAIEREITTGRESGSFTEVLAGIVEGDRVIEKPGDKITNGAKVKVL